MSPSCSNVLFTPTAALNAIADNVYFFGRKAVLGFSGNIQQIQRIVHSLEIKARNYQSSGNLKADLTKWIEGAVKHKVHRQHSTQFLLCDLDPSTSPGIYVFHVDKDSPNVRVQHEPLVAVIGSGQEQEAEIREILIPMLVKPSRTMSYEAHSHLRALWGSYLPASIFSHLDSKDVGGPFMVIRVRAEGIIGPDYTWPGSGDMSDVERVDEGTITILRQPSTGKEYVLYSINNIRSSGFFGDPNASA